MLKDVDLASGRLSNRRIFVAVDPVDGVPDGSTVDAEGYLWSTHWGGSCITRYAPDGRVDRTIEMPVAKITSCAFGGEHMDTLFVTTASVELRDGRWVEMDDAGFAEAPTTGGIFAIDVGIKGLPEPAFTAATG